MTSNFWLCLLFGCVAFATLNGCTTAKPGPAAPEAQQTLDPQPSTIPIPRESADVQTTDSPSQKNTASKPRVVDPANAATETALTVQPPKTSKLTAPTNKPTRPALPILPPVLDIKAIQKTGNLQNTALTEISGFSASKDWPGVIYAINDSGNAAKLYAISESGKHLGEWTIEGRNRDWEDLTSIALGGKNYVVIGDTGDNLNVHKTNTLYFIREPVPGSTTNQRLKPHMSISFAYEDGPRNVEAFAIHDTTLYLISKEPIVTAGTQPSRLYSLNIPTIQPANNLIARFLTTLPPVRQSLEAKLAASFVGVDLNHPTALDIDPNGRTAYLLSYRQVLRYQRLPEQSWAQAFQTSGKQIHFHQLGQAEALALAPGRAVFITSENPAAPVWAIPVGQYQ
ncbi:MAG: hypothetical protein AB8B84_06435 [Granulosicoccus sp.]